jgi:amino acid adenylation domain-containing protein
LEKPDEKEQQLQTRVAVREEGVAELRSGLSDKKRAALEKLMRARAEKAQTTAQQPVRATIPRREGRGPALLSFGQERLWFLDRLEPGSPLYNIPVFLRLEGDLDVPAFAAGLAEVVRRHEVLRSTFPAIQDGPRQAVAPPSPFPLPILDLTALPAVARRAESVRLAEEEYRTGFDLIEGPVIRGTLVRLEAGTWMILLVLHHIVSDGWSFGVLVRELATLYTAFRQGLPSPLPELPIQYADYAEWQRRALQGDALDAQLAWWKRELAGAPTTLELPLDRPRPPLVSTRGAHVPWRFPAELGSALADLHQREGVTMFMLLLAAWQTLLGRVTAQDDLLVGSPVSDRPRPETEGLIGFFVNTLVLRARLAGPGGPPSFRELLGQVRETVLGAFAHQDLPFERLVDELQEGRALDRNPLFQVAFALQSATAAGASVEIPGLRLSTIEVAGEISKFDLNLAAMEVPGGAIEAAIEYNTDLFDRATVVRLLRHLETLLQSAVEEPDRKLPELPILSEDEVRQVLVEWNDRWTGYPRDATVHRLFEEQARRRPDALAAVFDEESLTYAELDRRSGRLAAALSELGAGPGTAVAIYLERGLDMVVSTLAVLRTGGAYVPLDMAYPEERLAFMLEDTAAPVLITREAWLDRFAHVATHALCLDRDREWIDAHPSGFASAEVPAEALAYVIYTSGSTGRPKGVAVPHRGIVRLLLDTDYVDLREDDVIAQASNTSFDAATFEIWGALLHGGRMAGVTKDTLLSPRDLAAQIRRDGITRLFLTTALFNQTIREVPDAFAPLRTLLFGGEAVDPARVRQALAAGPPERLLHVYGPTESTTYASWHPVEEVEEGAVTVPIGQPLANTTLVLLDRDLRPVPVGVTGELYVGGDGLAWGYLNRPELTAERFVPDPFARPGSGGGRLYKTGDLVRRRYDGAIEFQGRADFQVKIRGFRIELGEIEGALLAVPGVHEAAVLVEGQGGDKRLVAYVGRDEGADGTAVTPSLLREQLAERLPAFMVPAAFAVLDRLPLNPNGKVDRKALARIEAEEAHSEESGEAVTLTPTEEMLAGAWSDLLGEAAGHRIRPSDDFFELGGHSLLATRLVSRVRDLFEVDLPLRAVFQVPTLARMAERIDALALESRGLLPPPILPLSAEERGPRPPLSFAQERLWFLDRLDPGSVSYNVPAALLATGTPSVPALEAALDEVVRRHEALRTSFDQVGGEPFQVIAPALRIPVPVVDLTALPAERREAEAVQRLAEDAGRPFDLTRGPLLRALLVRLTTGGAGGGEVDPERWAMLLDMHHIVSDGWSVGVLTAELGALYEAYLSGRPSPLPELPVQYADFSVWQRRWLQGDVLDAQIAYWKERLHGVRTVLELPTDRPRPAVQSFHGGHGAADLPAPLPAELRTLSRASGATLFMTLLAGFQALLHRYTSQEDILVGSPVANRNRSEVEGLIGFFVNTLVLRGDLRSPSPAGAPSFRELLGRVRGAALGAYAHQDLPFERLVDELRIERSLARNPLYQVVFSLHQPAGGLSLPGLRLDPLTLEGATAKVDLLLSFTDDPSGGASDRPLSGVWEYAADLFDPSTIERLSGHLVSLLRAAAANPERPVSELPLLTAAESEQILGEWNDTRVGDPDDLCLHELFERWARRTPDAIAATFDGRSTSYGDLALRSDRLAATLQRLGAGLERLVGICLEPGIERLIAVLGVFKAGAAYVPLDPKHPRERLAWMMEDGRMRVLVTESALLDRLPEHEAEKILMDGGGESPDAAALAPSCVDSGHLAYVIYTSGSTGRPNGVLVPHRAAVNLIRRAIVQLEVEPESRVLQSVSFSFDASVLETWIALGSGATLCIARRETLLSNEALAEMLRGEAITHAVMTPSVLGTLEPHGLPALRTVTVGGDNCPGEVATRWAPPSSGLRQLFNCYGPTETTIYTTSSELRGVYRKEPPIGRPMGNTRMYVLDPNGQPVPAGVPGALWVGGVGVARGYLNRPELTAERFAPDPFAAEGEPGGRLYRTGDLTRWLPGGELEFLGRIDRQVKVRGLRIELGEIEAALGSHPGLDECVVLAREDGRGGKRLVAYAVAAREEPRPTAQDLRDHLRGRLPEYMVPASFVFLDALPRTPTDKVDRAALLQMDQTLEGTGDAVRVEPRDLVELELVRIWREVLGVPYVGVRDNFFDAGGHSLLAVRLMARIQQRFGRDLPLTVLFQGGTIEEMAALLRGEAGEGRASSLVVPIQPSGVRPPFFAVHPAGGDVLCFAGLARLLGPDQPFYGLQSRGLAGDGEPVERIEEMAALYLEQIRAVQPEGPYRLGGWSLGGVIAFEMARQLRERGEEVALLAVLDSVPDLAGEAAGFQSDVDFLFDMALYVENLWGRELGLTREELERLAPDDRIERLAERLRAADFLPPGAGVDQLRRILRVYRANVESANHYTPRPFDGRVTLFKAAELPPVSEGAGGMLAEPDYGWGPLSAAPVDVHVVPGRHLTLLVEPNVEELARRLASCLEEAEVG